ncbi:centrosomal protein of 170 kDa protein B isoform X2 [Amia ocellicauda]|uniref:centrosomal protein of 170 kDa protein B isoform X2 n=1 Tax=Amia ocellicauda TaxID=2972642 RepID=UPI003463CE57
MSVTSWFLVSSSGIRHRLPREMIFVGREDCELMLQSRSVDKQHAVINYDLATDEHLVKDLGSLNGTFVNDLRIPDQTYITLKLGDVIRFGYDPHVYMLERSQHRVPEEALKHEKYTSQLQMSLKASEGKKGQHPDEKGGGSESPRSKLEKAERKALSEAPMSRPTPLYGQPSWWGEDDAGNKVQHTEGRRPDEPHTENPKEGTRLDPEMNGTISDFRDSQGKSIYSYRREPSYFEIPTKEFQQHPKSPETEVHEIPTKDTDALPLPPTPTPPVVQSHASFTIEFDECTPGKMKIKDHVTKFSFRQRKPPSKDLASTPIEVMSAESKVADWLVHSDPSMMRRKAPCEDVYSTKSDLPIHIKTLKGHHHEDGTQSDSEDPIMTEMQGKQHQEPPQPPQQSLPLQQLQPQQPQPQPQPQPPQKPSAQQPQPPQQPLPPSPPSAPKEPTRSPTEPLPSPQIQPKQDAEVLNQQAFIIEFFDDNPRKKRSQSFTHNSAHADSYSALKAKLEKRKGALAGEKAAVVASGHIPPTQQITVPLKGQGPPQRASSLKREKTEDRLSSGSSLFSSRTSVAVKPFGSVGRKSKLAQEFAAEFLRESAHSVAPTREKTSPPPTSAPPVLISPSLSHPPAPPSPHSAPPVQSPMPLSAPLLPITVRAMDLKPNKAMRNEEEDSLSDAGTYTIETESQDKEVEEARNMIDQVFGVLESPEYTGVSSGVYRPVINDGREEQTSCRHSKSSTVDQKATPVQGYNPAAISGPQTGAAQVRPVGPVGLVGPKWVSRWASLADSYSEGGPIAGLYDQQPGELADGDGKILHTAMLARSVETTDSEGSQAMRTRRLLPQVPPAEKAESPTPSILIRHDPYPGYENPERVSSAPRQQENIQRLCVQDDLDPDSLSDASRSDDGSLVERSRKHRTGRTADKAKPEKLFGDKSGTPHRLEDKTAPSTRSTSFYIGSEERHSKPDVGHSPVSSHAERDPDISSKPFATTVLIKPLNSHDTRKPVKSTTHKSHTQEKEALPAKELSISFVRQESFTKDRPSDDVPINKLPHISSHPALKDLDAGDAFRADCSQDTQAILKETENALAALEAKFQAQEHVRGQKHEASSRMEDSLSGESDVDTASTVSLVSNKNAPTTAPKKRLVISSLQKEKSSSSPSIQDQGRQPTARERLSEKRRTHLTDNSSKAELTKRFQLRRSTGNRGSLDFTEDLQSHSLPYWPDTVSSDHESSSRPTTRKKLTTQLQKEDSSKSSKGMVFQALTRSNSLSAPRPTRASMLRRARLGEASDNEGTETDKGSDVNAPTKSQADSKKLSRLDILAMPRKRTGSFTAPSDTESSAPRSGFSNRSIEASTTVRKASVPDPKPGARRATATTAKQPISRARSSSAKYSSSRRRQKGSDYTSTSDEEYDSNHSSPKHKRSHASTATQTPRAQAAASGRQKHSSRETEEEEEDNDADPYQHWSTHSAEIARLSQDLAKDLAILAREIHDVAGDADSQSSSGTGPSTSLSSVPNTPASTISAREEKAFSSSRAVRSSQLVQHIPEASLNFQKVPPGSAGVKKELDQNMNDQDLNSKRRIWNREEVILDNLMLNPVSQLSQAIRENTEQLAEKMKILFHNKAGSWEEIEAKINSENEVPILKTSNKEISSILKELRRVQKQLEVINTIIDPSANPELGGRPIPGTAPVAAAKGRTAAKELRLPAPLHSTGQQGGGSNANERAKKAGTEEESCVV